MTAWYVARGAGLAALVLLSVTTAVGALMVGRGRPADRVVVQYLHRVTGSLGLAALGLHLGAILADSYAHVGWTAAMVPFTSAYRPTWVGLGTIAAYAVVLVAAVGFARGRIAASALGAKLWRGVHALAYVGWGTAMLHGLKSGTDTSAPWVRWLYIGCAITVGASIAVRFGLARRVDLVRGTQPVAAAVR